MPFYLNPPAAPPSSVLDRHLAQRMAELLLVQLQEQLAQRREAWRNFGALLLDHGRCRAWAADQERAAIPRAFHFERRPVDGSGVTAVEDRSIQFERLLHVAMSESSVDRRRRHARARRARRDVR